MGGIHVGTFMLSLSIHPLAISMRFPCSQYCLDEWGLILKADHPGFKDPAYRARRTALADLACSFKHGDRLPRIEYTSSETKTWYYSYINDILPWVRIRTYPYQPLLSILILLLLLLLLLLLFCYFIVDLTFEDDKMQNFVFVFVL